MCDAAITLIQGQLATSCSLSPIFSALATDFAGFGSTTTAADFTKPFNSFYESVCATGVYSCNNAVTTGSAAAGSQLGGAGCNATTLLNLQTYANYFAGLPTSQSGACNINNGTYCGADYFISTLAVAELILKNNVSMSNVNSVSPYVSQIKPLICNPCFASMNAHADETSGVFNLFGVGDVLNVTPFPLIEYNALCSSYGSNSSNITTSKTKATATATKSSYPSNTPSGYGSCSADPFFQSLFKCGPNIVNDLNQIKNDMNPSSPNPSAAINPLNDVFGSLCSSSCLTSAGGVLSGLVANCPGNTNITALAQVFGGITTSSSFCVKYSFGCANDYCGTVFLTGVLGLLDTLNKNNITLSVDNIENILAFFTSNADAVQPYFCNSCFAPVLTDAQTLVGLVGLFGIDLSMLSNEASYLSILSNFCPGYTETKSCHTGTPTAIYGGPTSTPTKSSYGGPTTTKRPSPVPTINYDLLSKDCKKYYNNAGNSFKNIASICKMPKGYQTAEQQIAKAFYGSYSSANPPSKSQYDGILTKVDALLAPYCNKKGKCMTVLNGDLNNVQQKCQTNANSKLFASEYSFINKAMMSGSSSSSICTMDGKHYCGSEFMAAMISLNYVQSSNFISNAVCTKCFLTTLSNYPTVATILYTLNVNNTIIESETASPKFWSGAKQSLTQVCGATLVNKYFKVPAQKDLQTYTRIIA